MTTLPPRNLPPNPCIEARIEQGYADQAAWARKHRVSNTAVYYVELGCYSKPLPFYFKYLKPGDLQRYQEFRVARRKLNFPTPPPVLPFKELLKELNITGPALARKLAVQTGDVHRMVKMERIHVPVELIKALKDVGWTDEDIRILSRDHILLYMKKYDTELSSVNSEGVA